MLASNDRQYMLCCRATSGCSVYEREIGGGHGAGAIKLNHALLEKITSSLPSFSCIYNATVLCEVAFWAFGRQALRHTKTCSNCRIERGHGGLTHKAVTGVTGPKR